MRGDRRAKIHSSVLAILFLFIFLCLSQGHAQTEPYGAYGLFPQGANRVTAMGGASASLSDDASGVAYNPAGLGFQHIWGDLAGNYNVVANREADLNGDNIKDGIPYSYAYYAGSLTFGNFGLGIGFSSPYAADFSFDSANGIYTDNRHMKLSITSIDVGLAYRLTGWFSVGATVQGQTLDESYQFSSTNPATAPASIKAQQSQSFVNSGIMVRPNQNWGFGAWYSPERRFSVNSTALNAQTTSTNWFRSVVIPAKASAGIFFKPHPLLLLATDVDYFSPVQGAVYVGSDLVTGFQKILIDDQPKAVVHGGMEWNFIATHMWDFYFRLGTYNEPPRIRNASARQHSTGGLEIRWWILSLSFSADTATDFSNSAARLGLTLKYYL